MLLSANVMFLSKEQKEEKKLLIEAKKIQEQEAKIKKAMEDGKIQCIKCETCQKILKPMSQHGKTRKHNVLNDKAAKCDGSGKQGAVVWLSKEEVELAAGNG